MKNLNPIFPALLLFFGVLFGCAKNSKEAHVEADIIAIEALYEQYLQYVNSGDLDLFMSVWTDDATRSEPGIEAIIGKENIRMHFKTIFEHGTFKMVFCDSLRVQVLGDQGWAYSTVILSGTFKDGSPSMITDVKWLDIVKRQDDGSWKIYIDCINYHPTWKKDSIPKELLDEQNPFY